MNEPAHSNLIPPEKQREIERRLTQAEQEHDVKVLLAIESGSRAWGFASPNSDFDGRFIYVHRPEWYLAITLEEQRDVIEYPIVDDMDVNGWDLRKALRLFWKSNPAIVEWLQSPIQYVSVGSMRPRCLELLGSIYSIERGVHHYRSTTKSNFRSHLQGELIPLKKYFYTLRPILAVRWLMKYQQPAPIEFATLLQMLDGESDVRAAIDELLIVKRNSPEMGLAPPVPAIQAFIAAEIERHETLEIPRDEREGAAAVLNQLFRELLHEAWAT